MARCWAAPRITTRICCIGSMLPGSATLYACRGELLRAWQPYVEAQLARGVALKHMTRHILGLFHGERGGRAFRQILSEGAHRPGADWSLIEQALAVTERYRDIAA